MDDELFGDLLGPKPSTSTTSKAPGLVPATSFRPASEPHAKGKPANGADEEGPSLGVAIAPVGSDSGKMTVTLSPDELSAIVDKGIQTALDTTFSKFARSLRTVLEDMTRRIASQEATVVELRAAITELRDAVADQPSDLHIRFTNLDMAIKDVERGVQALRDRQELQEAQQLLAMMSSDAARDKSQKSGSAGAPAPAATAAAVPAVATPTPGPSATEAASAAAAAPTPAPAPAAAAAAPVAPGAAPAEAPAPAAAAPASYAMPPQAPAAAQPLPQAVASGYPAICGVGHVGHVGHVPGAPPLPMQPSQEPPPQQQQMPPQQQMQPMQPPMSQQQQQPMPLQQTVAAQQMQPPQQQHQQQQPSQQGQYPYHAQMPPPTGMSMQPMARPEATGVYGGPPTPHAPPVYAPYGTVPAAEAPRAPVMPAHGMSPSMAPPMGVGGPPARADIPGAAPPPAAPPPPQMVSYPAPPAMQAYPPPPSVPHMQPSLQYGRLPQAVQISSYRTGVSGSAPPQAGPGGGAPPTSRTVPLDKIIADISQMGFNRNDVLAAVNSLQASGKALDLNTIIDKLTRG